MKIWKAENPHQTVECDRDTLKVKVFLAISVTSPIFMKVGVYFLLRAATPLEALMTSVVAPLEVFLQLPFANLYANSFDFIFQKEVAQLYWNQSILAKNVGEINETKGVRRCKEHTGVLSLLKAPKFLKYHTMSSFPGGLIAFFHLIYLQISITLITE